MNRTFPESPLYQDVLAGTYKEEPELERLMEMREFIDRLTIQTHIFANHVSNPVPLTGFLPTDKTAILHDLTRAITNLSETILKDYRDRVRHL